MLSLLWFGDVVQLGSSRVDTAGVYDILSLCQSTGVGCVWKNWRGPQGEDYFEQTTELPVGKINNRHRGFQQYCSI